MLHKFKLGGFNIVLDPHSGAVHVVDDLSYNILDRLTPPLTEKCPNELRKTITSDFGCSDEELDEVWDELYSLYSDQRLFAPDEYEKYSRFVEGAPIKSMCLHIAHDCNLRCKYCFASTGDFGHGRKLMTLETGKKAIDFLIQRSVGRKNLELDFFGGEPLMNFDVVKQLVEYGREQERLHDKCIRFTITTNGVLLSEDKYDFINREMSNIVLSLDGRPEVNDRMRPCIGGTGSYDVIMPKFKRLVELRGDKEYYVRGTYTKYNLDFSEDVFHLLDCGFEQVSVEPVVAPPDTPYALTEDDLPKLFSEYERLADRIYELKKTGGFINFFHFMIDLDNGPCAIKRLRGCGCGNEYVAITPDGDIFPCHQFVGIDGFKMGNLDDQTFDEAMKERFAHTHIYTKEKCRDCWAKFYCSGGCNANNYQANGDMLKPYELGCEIQKKRLECAIMLKIREKLGDSDEV